VLLIFKDMNRQKVTVYCLPFAGGNQHSYSKFADYTSEHISFLPVELPGRGARWKEPLLTDIHAITNDVFKQVSADLSNPYAIYGHSMGSLLGYLLTKKALARQLPPPLHLFFSGAHEPTRPMVKHPRHLFSKEEFLKKLKDLGGSPDEVLDDPMMLDFYEPLLRADFQATDSYQHKPSKPFDIPITVMIGMEEGITIEQALAWQQETTIPIEVFQFPGKHFFIYEYVREIIELIELRLKPVPAN
jgi:surfactin synthase thioesterase subunit